MSCSNCTCNKPQSNPVQIGTVVSDFTLKGYWKDDIHSFSLTDYRGKWVVVFFYPGDFTFVCPTELEDLAKQYKNFTDLNVEILAISTDSSYTHKAWKDESPAVATVDFPLLSDTTHTVSKQFNVYMPDAGTALRGTFVIDSAGILRAYEVHDTSIGRSAKELLRKVQAAQHVDTHPGNVCPASWEPGDETLVPSIELVGKI